MLQTSVTLNRFDKTFLEINLERCQFHCRREINWKTWKVAFCFIFLPVNTNINFKSSTMKNDFTAPFNNMRTLKFGKAQPTMCFSIPSIKCSAAPPCFRLLPSGPLSNLWAQFRHRNSARHSSRKLGGAAKHSIDGSEKRICRLSFEF